MARMTAQQIARQGGKFERVERDLPEPGEGHVRLRVHACGVCHSDQIAVEGQMPGIAYPLVPGHEVIGTIEEVGRGVSGFEVGTRVGVGWNPGFCGDCRECRRGNTFACENIEDVTGVYRDGGYATHMLARETALARVPDELDAVESAPLLCAGITTFNALRNCGAGPGNLVAIFGVGGLGHLAVQYAARMGYRTVAINRGTQKRDLALELGAHDYIDSEAGDAAQRLRDMGGADAILSTLTSAEAMESIVGGLGARGTMMIIGAVGPITVDPLSLIQKSGTVRGWYSGVATESQECLEFSALTDTMPMIETYPLERAQDAYDRMASGDARFRVVLDCSEAG